MTHQPINNSSTHWLAVYIFNNDINGAAKLIGMPDVDHDEALLEVIRSGIVIFDGGLNIINRLVNGYLIKDTSAVIQACVLHGNVPILEIIISKYTKINKDWFYYAWDQLLDNQVYAYRAQNTVRWILNYAAKHKITLQTSEILTLLNTSLDKELVYGVLDCVFDNSEHYKSMANKLFTLPVCDLGGVVVRYLYDRRIRNYTLTEYATATLRAHIAGLACI